MELISMFILEEKTSYSKAFRVVAKETGGTGANDSCFSMNIDYIVLSGLCCANEQTATKASHGCNKGFSSLRV